MEGPGMTRTLRAIGGFGLVALLTTGCLVKDTTETWYVDAAGAVTWVVMEKDVRSDANTLADRQQEESLYWFAVQQQRHPMAAGLSELSGDKVRTFVLRGESPYTVRTEARFSGLDELGRRIIATTGLMGTSIVTREGPVWEWKFVVRDPSSVMSTTEPSEGVAAVMESADALQVVLVFGRFDSAEGFTLSNDGRVATINLKDDTSREQAEQPTMTLRLTWKTP
jgi:hypothetical protein